MDDQRVVRRAAFGSKDARHGGVVASISAQAIDGFCRYADQAALDQGLHRAG